MNTTAKKVNQTLDAMDAFHNIVCLEDTVVALGIEATKCMRIGHLQHKDQRLGREAAALAVDLRCKESHRTWVITNWLGPASS